jgi:mannonate dehydratase
MAMDRRKFIAACGTGVTLAGLDRAAAAGPAESPPGKLKMHLGTQLGPTTPEMLDYFKRHGVEAICGWPPILPGRGYWTREDLERTRDLCTTHGIALEMVGLPLVCSGNIDRGHDAILLADDPQRDRDLEQIQRMIAACAQAGVPAVKYNVSLLGVLRTGTTLGRGGSRYSTWRLGDAKQEPPLTRAGRITEELFWQRITYFLERVIPVCNQYKIRAACHPHDPGVPPQGFRGVCCVLGTVDGLKRFVSIQESPYHGLNFCVGTVAEMLRNPGREIHEVIRYFGQRKKIFNIHFRNIRGHRDDFREVYPDEGDLDMVQVARDLQAVDYPYMVMPDHVPSHPADPRSLQAFAYAQGYIKGVLQTLAAVPS